MRLRIVDVDQTVSIEMDGAIGAIDWCWCGHACWLGIKTCCACAPMRRPIERARAQVDAPCQICRMRVRSVA